MSSLRNAVKRIAHKERSQPQARAHFGILEKKKDYRQRAQDFHRKQDRIQAMRRKASMRNPDEFYFGMNNAEIHDGRHRKTQRARQEENGIAPETVRLMKDQDLSYVRLQKQRDARKVEKLKTSLHYLGVQVEEKRKHTIFVDSQQDADNFDVAKHFGTVPELAGRSFNRPRVETLETAARDESLTEKELLKQVKIAKRTAKKVARARASAYREMEARQKRMEAMAMAVAHLETEKLVSTSKGRKRKIQEAQDGMPAVYKWRRKRLR